MRDFLLDTQTIRYWYDEDCPQHQSVIDNLESLQRQSATLDPKPKLLVSVITLGEIEFGHGVQVGDQAALNDDRLKFVNEQLPERLEVTEDAVAAYGKIRSRLFNKYAPGERRRRGMRPEQLVDPITSLLLQIQENDLWLCAQAVAHEMILVTNDKMRAIREVAEGMAPDLRIQNWTEAGTAQVE